MNIFVTEPDYQSDTVRSLLGSIGNVEFGYKSEKEFLEKLKKSNVLMVRLGRLIDETVVNNAPSLKFVLSATTALEHIDLKVTEKKNIQVLSLRNCMSEIQDISATAEHTWALLLSLLRNIPKAIEKVNSKQWSRAGLWGNELKGKNLGILGFGRLGKQVAQYGKAFGMNVYICDSDPNVLSKDFTSLSTADLFTKCNIISVHVTATKENIGLVSDELIKKMAPGSYLINTSRGNIVDSHAISRAVREGHLSGLAVDVIQDEEKGMFPDDPILSCFFDGFNVIITPHIGGATYESIEKAESALLNYFLKVSKFEEAKI